MKNSRLASRWQRPLYLSVGCMCLALGVVALVIPLIPGVVFLVLATACFSRSSPELEQWLKTHPRFGKLIVNWQSSGVLPRGAKWIIIASMLASYSLIFFETDSRQIQAAAAIVMLVVIAYVWQRPEQVDAP
ncbi:YbaN family protein [Hydrogenophaga laconesensis]|uniref:Uncharacterized membrane protein YbaN (DUF454 family) n=1 Tax=Hydrogenophaga laconesensis TaxID=1805971 RepID=A0ABU1VIL2_9BURK|nr:YbaN family protein [Hydrogenophaga laconesensis]MDR7097315.1 uncharacterized membrane protein YbaN (DUF454 family) [Hydrogenophaga laconesensis]